MKNSVFGSLLLLTVGFLIAASFAMAGEKGPAMRVKNAIWAHDQIYSTILTPTSFQMPPSHSVDKLYNFDMSGLSGQRSVSEAAPGDPGYNGGRWWVQAVVFTEQGISVHDPDGDGLVNFELSNAEAVLHHAGLGHLTILSTSTYFECPLLKSKNSP
jgi:hypothetical protein